MVSVHVKPKVSLPLSRGKCFSYRDISAGNWTVWTELWFCQAWPVHQVWPKPSCKGTVKGGRRPVGRQRKRWEDNTREWTGLEFAKSQKAVENREQRRKLVAKSFVVPQRPSRLRDRWWWRRFSWTWTESIWHVRSSWNLIRLQSHGVLYVIPWCMCWKMGQ